MSSILIMLMVIKMNFFLHKVFPFALQITTSNTNYQVMKFLIRVWVGGIKMPITPTSQSFNVNLGAITFSARKSGGLNPLSCSVPIGWV